MICVSTLHKSYTPTFHNSTPHTPHPTPHTANTGRRLLALLTFQQDLVVCRFGDRDRLDLEISGLVGEREGYEVSFLFRCFGVSFVFRFRFFFFLWAERKAGSEVLMMIGKRMR
jgi:hypothetical protein